MWVEISMKIPTLEEITTVTVAMSREESNIIKSYNSASFELNKHRHNKPRLTIRKNKSKSLHTILIIATHKNFLPPNVERMVFHGFQSK